MEQFARTSLPEGKRVFFLYTCANNSRDFAASLRAIAAERGADDLGIYACKGFNTYGPWKLVGGMNKKHPTGDEIQGAVDFLAALERKVSAFRKDKRASADTGTGRQAAPACGDRKSAAIRRRFFASLPRADERWNLRGLTLSDAVRRLREAPLGKFSPRGRTAPE